MPIGTPFHPRTSALCESMSWRDWAGYFAVSAYEVHHDREYNAIRNAAALIDVSPLFKYRVAGRDAARLVDRIVTRDARKMAGGQVSYTHWAGVDSLGARRALIPPQAQSPSELGLGWVVNREKAPFMGQAGLRRAAREGPWRQRVGLDVDWKAVERRPD